MEGWSPLHPCLYNHLDSWGQLGQEVDEREGEWSPLHPCLYNHLDSWGQRREVDEREGEG